MTHVKAFPRGGVRPPDLTHLSRSAPITNASIPALAVIPMLQHEGAPARCLVKPGDRVREGTVIGEAVQEDASRIHSSIPGRVAEVLQTSLPGGEPCLAAVIELGGEFEISGKPPSPRAWDELSRKATWERIRSAGVVGLGRAAQEAGVEILVANGIEAEPFLTARYSLMREKPREIAEGLRICRRLLNAKRVVLAVEEEAVELVPAFERVFEELRENCEIVAFPSVYPQGHAELVLAALTGGSDPPGRAARAERTPSDDTVAVLDVATLLAVFEAVVLDKPVIERVITITGLAIGQPRNLRVRIGARVGDLFDECGGFREEPGKVVLGGPMMGTAIRSFQAPVTKAVNGIVAFTREEARRRREYPCVRCGTCVQACPWGLAPTRLYKLIERGAVSAAYKEGLSACTECGCCSYACPSRIPLAAGMRRGRSCHAPGTGAAEGRVSIGG